MELLKPGISIDFVAKGPICAVLSLGLVLASLALMIKPGFRWGIDFAGGTVVEVDVAAEVGELDEAPIRTVLAEIGFPEAGVVRLGTLDDRSFRISVKASEETNPNLSIEILEALSAGLGGEVTPRRIESIGPRIGGEQQSRAIGALVLSWALILLYIWFRFDLRYAPGAVAALVHDVLITAGIFVALGWEFNLQILAALLVVIGYSLNDTIVVYDRIRENIDLRGATHVADVVNQSINQTLSRTLLTTLTTLSVVVSIIVLGGPVLRGFAIALAIGVTVGTYSTIYVASNLLILLERRYKGLRPAAGA